MVSVALLNFYAVGKDRLPLAELPLTQALLDALRRYQCWQFRPRTVLATVRDWALSGGGRPERVLEKIRAVVESPNPYVLCFGPALNRRFISCFARAHALVAYRVEGARVYVYDPNNPGDRERFVEYWRGGAEFAYDDFRSWEGWGITVIAPLRL